MSTTAAEAWAELDAALVLARRTCFSVDDAAEALRIGTAAGLTLEQATRHVEVAHAVGAPAPDWLRTVVGAQGSARAAAMHDDLPVSMADRWDQLAGSIRHLASVLREEAIGNWRPLAIATGLTWLGLVIALVIA